MKWLKKDKEKDVVLVLDFIRNGVISIYLKDKNSKQKNRYDVQEMTYFVGDKIELDLTGKDEFGWCD